MIKTVKIFQTYNKIIKQIFTKHSPNYNLIYTKLKESPEATINPTLNNTATNFSSFSRLAVAGKHTIPSLLTLLHNKNNHLIREGHQQIKKNTQLLNKYISSLSKFNLNIANSQIIEYNFNRANSKLFSIDDFSYIFNNSFYSMSSIVSKPIFYNTPAKMVIYLFYYTKISTKKKMITLINGNGSRRKKIKYTITEDNKKILYRNSSKLAKLSEFLSKKVNKEVTIELVRLYYPVNNSDILAKAIGFICNKIKFRNILNKVFDNAPIINPSTIISYKPSLLTKIPTILCGLKIKLGGRLLTHRVVPRKTVKMDQEGSLSRRYIKFMDTGRLTNKNKRGAYSITVTSGHISR